MNLENLEKTLKNRLDIYHSRIASDCDNILEAEIAQLLEKIEDKTNELEWLYEKAK